MDDWPKSGSFGTGATGPAERNAAAGRPIRVAVIADGAGAVPGQNELLAQLRAHAVAGYEVELLGTGPEADRRLAAAAEIELPLFPGQLLGVPSLFAVAQAIVQRRYDALHLCAPAPASVIALLMATLAGVPVTAGFDETLLRRAGEQITRTDTQSSVTGLLRAYYGQCDVVLSSSPAADASLALLGIKPGRISRWQPGVDVERFNPRRYASAAPTDASFNVLHVGAFPRCAESELLVEAFLVGA